MRKVIIGPENTEIENNTILLIVEDAPQEFDAVSYNNIILSDIPLTEIRKTGQIHLHRSRQQTYQIPEG